MTLEPVDGVCGRCGGSLSLLPIYDMTYGRSFAKCQDCGCFHGELKMNVMMAKSGLMQIQEGMFWNPVF